MLRIHLKCSPVVLRDSNTRPAAQKKHWYLPTHSEWDSGKLQLTAVTQPFDNAGVAFDDGRGLAGPIRRRVVVHIVDRSARIHSRNVREKYRAVGRATVAQHLLIAVAGQAQVFEELLEVAGGGLWWSPVAVTDIRFGPENRPIPFVTKAFLSFECCGWRVDLPGSAVRLLAAVV